MRSPGLPSIASRCSCPRDRPVAEVIAVAKRDLAAGTTLEPAIGGDQLYGEIERRDAADALGAVPICLLDRNADSAPLLTRAVRRDEPLLWQDIELPDSDLLAAYRSQERMLGDLRPFRHSHEEAAP